MALIRCSECGKEISSEAETCPHCGYRTSHGKAVAEVRGYALSWVIASVITFVGIFMMLANLGEYREYIDYVDHWEYFSDETQKSLQSFGIGLLVFVAGLGDMIIVSLKAKRTASSSYSRYESSVASTWRCEHCNTVNQSDDRVCTICSIPRSGQRQASSQNIPTWKRIQMEEEKNTQASQSEIRCSHCGESMSIGQKFCGACGQPKE